MIRSTFLAPAILVLFPAAPLLAQTTGGPQTIVAPPIPSPPPTEVPAGATVAVHAAPRTDPATWLSSDDYPPESLRNGEQGEVRVTLLVALDGRIADCTLVASSGSAVLDSRTCQLLKRRARFTPAKQPDGSPMIDHWPYSFTWALPKP